MTTKTLLVLGLLICASTTLQDGLRDRCLCRRTRTTFGNTQNIQDIQIHPATPSCDKMEIIVFLRSGIQYCLDPEIKKIQELISHLQTK